VFWTVWLGLRQSYPQATRFNCLYDRRSLWGIIIRGNLRQACMLISIYIRHLLTATLLGLFGKMQACYARGSKFDPRRGHDLYLLLDHVGKHWWAQCFTVAPSLPTQIRTLRLRRKLKLLNIEIYNTTRSWQGDNKKNWLYNYKFHPQEGGTYKVIYQWVLLSLGKLRILTHKRSNTRKATGNHIVSKIP